MASGSYGRGDTFITADQGVLRSVERHGESLRLAIDFDGRIHTGTLLWDAPPTPERVEEALRANIGKEMKVIGEIDVLD
jgi:hypothetical protein